MSSSTKHNPTVLNQTFQYQSATHSFSIKWCSVGNPEAQPLIFIHGTPWSSRVWEPFARALSRQFHVYLFDNPGFGESPIEQEIPDAGFTPNGDVSKWDSDLARQSEAFAALFQSWEKADWAPRNLKPHVIAHDHGGLQSLRANLLHGCEYASLCLIDVVAIGPFGQPLFKALVQSPEYFEALPDSAFEGILESYIRDAAYHELPRETMKMLKAPWLREGGKKGFLRQMCQAAYRSTEAVEGRYAEVGQKMPVKVVWGAEDYWVRVDTAERLGSALRAREVAVIQEAGHLSFYDQPAEVGVEFARWLTAVSMEKSP